MTKEQNQKRFRELLFILSVSALLGIATDFLFNGVAVRVLFHLYFKEEWIFIYGPLYLALASTLFTLLLRSRWSALSTHGAVAFICGTIVGHLAFISHHGTRAYSLTLVSDSQYVLLRSNDWPQVLFIEGERVRQELLQHSTKEQIPVTVDVITDYGCIRTAAVSTVAHVDVKDDHDAAWTWRLNKYVTTSERNGPGMEDLLFPWCRHIPQLKMMGDGPSSLRPWEELLQKGGT